MLQLTSDIRINTRRLRAIVNNAEKTAATVRLVYVDTQSQGIERLRHKTGFVYRLGNKRLQSARHIERIRKLVIPPAWTNVWICPLENGHLQATGYDARGRKQYKYHALWTALRNHTKFYRMHAFGSALPAMRAHLEADLSLPGLPREKVLAAVVALMQHTSIRVGNSIYEKLYGSFGLTTLKDEHVNIKGPELRFRFRGKKGVSHAVTLRSKRLAGIVKKCRDIPGKELFQYIDKDGNTHSVDSGMVNTYIRRISGQDFCAKDFRTWSGSLQALTAFGELGPCTTKTALKRNLVTALDLVAEHLGNTRSVCKKYYVHPILLQLYASGRLHAHYLKRPNQRNAAPTQEELFLKLLKNESLTIHQK